VEKTVSIAAMNTAGQTLRAMNWAKTPKNVHLATNTAGERINHDCARELQGELKEDFEDHLDMLALSGRYE
jgi:hypothetical protein